MTNPSARRTVLATGAAALLAGCSKYGDEGGGESSQEASSAGSSKEGDAPDDEQLATTGDIPVGGGTIFKEQKIVVTQPEKGDFKAFSAICTHAGCTVGSVADGTINCPCHGSRFRIEDASVAHGPATRPLPAEKITVSGNSIRRA